MCAGDGDERVRLSSSPPFLRLHVPTYIKKKNKFQDAGRQSELGLNARL